jgi:diaminohydroxyphosphoribosylaminopyrimidine deaminase/5-amino-6-(5-phosphoribosylamino)uracil reductase
VFDSEARTPIESKLVQTAGKTPTTVIASDHAHPDRIANLRAAGVDVMLSSSLRQSMVALRTRDIRSVFLEAGPQLSGAFLRESLVDRLTIFRSSLVLGADAPKGFAFAPPGFESALSNARIVAERRFGEDSMITYALQELSCSPD